MMTIHHDNHDAKVLDDAGARPICQLMPTPTYRSIDGAKMKLSQLWLRRHTYPYPH
jgi:hypothetical protein